MKQPEGKRTMALLPRENMRGAQSPAAKVGEVIRRKRRRMDGRWLDQKQLAALIGMSQANLSRIESGEVSPTLDALCAIAEALEMTVYEIVVEAGL
jgi:transcriptional regulator with XRE-family HTH domain